MVSFKLRTFCVAMLVASVSVSENAHSQINFSNSGDVSAGSPITGFLTDADGDSVGYQISNFDSLIFGWNGSGASEAGGVQDNFGAGAGPFNWDFTLTFDSPIDSLSLGQTLAQIAGANAGGTLTLDTDAASAVVLAGTQGLGADGLSNLNNVVIAGGDVSATLAPTFNNEDDWLITLNNVQSVNVVYEPQTTSVAGVGAEWLTFVNADIASAVPEPSTLLGLSILLTATALRRRRV